MGLVQCGGRILPQVQDIRGWFLCRRGHQAVDFFVGDTRVFNILLRVQLLVALAPGRFQDTVAIVGIREARSLATTQPQIGLAFRWVRNDVQLVCKWVTVPKTRDMYIPRRRVPLAGLCGSVPQHNGRGPDSSLKRRLIFVWTCRKHCTPLGTVTQCKNMQVYHI